MLFARVKNHCKDNAFEKRKLKPSDLGFSWNPEYKRVESGIQKVGIRNPEPLWILLHGSKNLPRRTAWLWEIASSLFDISATTSGYNYKFDRGRNNATCMRCEVKLIVPLPFLRAGISGCLTGLKLILTGSNMISATALVCATLFSIFIFTVTWPWGQDVRPRWHSLSFGRIFITWIVNRWKRE